MAKKTVASIVGARPQFIKAAPVSRALASQVKEVLIHTGQHYDYEMSEVFFEEMEMRKPDINLGIGGGSHGEQTGRMLVELDRTLATIQPDLVLVYGDTNSTLAGALAAVKMHKPVAHVEAGLRSFNRKMPEEVNRLLTDHISTLLFCPTRTAIENLKKEGITQGVFHVGDVMFDAIQHDLSRAQKSSKILTELGLQRGGYALATIHRAANTDDANLLAAIVSALNSLPTRVIFPLHPRTKKMISKFGIKTGSNLTFIAPVGRLDFLLLQENANCILTDSGGMQKEAYILGVRCITLRGETEWTETIEAGWNKLAGIKQGEIRDLFESWHPSGERPPLYGNGHAAEEICRLLAETFV